MGKPQSLAALQKKYEKHFKDKIEDEFLLSVVAHQCSLYQALRNDIEDQGVTVMSSTGVIKSNPNVYTCKSVGELILKYIKELGLAKADLPDELELNLR